MSTEELAEGLYDSEIDLTGSPTDLLRLERDDVTAVRAGTVLDRNLMNAMQQGVETPEALEALGEGMSDYRQRAEKQLESELPFEQFALRVRPQVINTAGATRMVGVRPGYERWISKDEDSVQLFQRLKEISGHEKAIMEAEPEDRPDELYEMHRLTGELAGFPDCAVENYAAGTRQNFAESLGTEQETQSEFRDRYGFLPTPETQMVIEDLENGNLETVLEYAKGERTVEDELPETFHSRMSSDFFPCRIDCDEAVQMGKQIEEDIESPEIQTKYRSSKAASLIKYALSQYQAWQDKGFEHEYQQPFEEHAQNGEIPVFEALEPDHGQLEQQLYEQAQQ